MSKQIKNLKFDIKELSLMEVDTGQQTTNLTILDNLTKEKVNEIIKWLKEKFGD